MKARWCRLEDKVPWRILCYAQFGIGLALLGVWVGLASCASASHDATPNYVSELCAAERQGCKEAAARYEELRDRDKEHCQVWLDQRDATIVALEERVKPCCPLGCERELLYKDYLFQAQQTYYKKHLKKVCGVRRPPEPTESELKGELSEEELDALE